MKTISVNLYEFDELAPDVQKKVLEKERSINVDHDWSEFLQEEFTRKLEESGYRAPQISFSGFWSQGDGASFTCKSIDLEKFITQGKWESLQVLLPLVKDDLITASIEGNSYHNHYSHSKTIYGNVDLDSSIEDLKIQDLCNTLERYIDQDAKSLSEDFYKELESAYDDLVSDAQVIDTIKANEYTFEADGTMNNS